ncbi:hypothetical protein A9Q91_04625 [Candidatus Gracilibacteria bacterium 28_42_T64]|nr:hypothetical protein A9Q91_04625 [Candidatus Gracilibacteria bacterium 28_42_T64]
MGKSETSKNMNLKHALCYIPLVAVIFFFTESNKSAELMKHIKYGIVLFIGYSLLQSLLAGILGPLLFFIYIGITVFLGFKAYNGEKVELEHIDNLEQKIKEKLETTEKKKK